MNNYTLQISLPIEGNASIAEHGGFNINNGIDNGNLWLGNDRIHVMSSRWNVTLRIEINGDRYPNSPNPNIYLYGTYNFSVNTILT